jgi:cell wall-associated NlpC family hydrolase
MSRIAKAHIAARAAVGLTVFGLMTAGAMGAAPAAMASTPTLNHAEQLVLCANTSDPYCGQTLTAGIPAGTAVNVTCYHRSDYYVVVAAHHNQQGYVPQSDVSGAPSGLSDCNTAAHPSIWAGAWAIGYLGTNTDVGLCLTFVIDAWRSTGTTIGSDASQTAASWWSSSYDIWPKHTQTSDPSRYLTPPRGALVFWGATSTSPAGHVAIAMGNGWLVSTEEGSTPGQAVHLVTIAHRNTTGAPYLGWVLP